MYIYVCIAVFCFVGQGFGILQFCYLIRSISFYIPPMMLYLVGQKTGFSISKPFFVAIIFFHFPFPSHFLFSAHFSHFQAISHFQPISKPFPSHLSSSTSRNGLEMVQICWLRGTISKPFHFFWGKSWKWLRNGNTFFFQLRFCT